MGEDAGRDLDPAAYALSVNVLFDAEGPRKLTGPFRRIFEAGRHGNYRSKRSRTTFG